MTTWNNADGLLVKMSGYERNPRYQVNRARAVRYESIQAIEMDVDLTQVPAGGVYFPFDLNNDGVPDGFSPEETYLPANSSVIRATLYMTEAAAGGTSITVGTYQQNGTAIAATGLVTATEGVLANINGVGRRVFGAGALTAAAAGTAGVGAVDAYVAIGATGTFTAGKGKLIIEYIPAVDV
jgi:hypothetical protein